MPDIKWRDRIIGLDRVDPRSLTAHPDNVRVHPAEQMKALEQLIGDVGQIAPIIASKSTGRVLNGHARLQLALDQERSSLEVLWVDVDEVDELAVLASFDAVAAMRDVKREEWAGLLRSASVRKERPWLQGVGGKLSVDAVQRGMKPLPKQRKRRKPEDKVRPTLWYVYVPRGQTPDVLDWLGEHVKQIDGVTIDALEEVQDGE